MVNFSVRATDSNPQTLALQAANSENACVGAFLDFEIAITLILDFTLNAQITVLLRHISHSIITQNCHSTRPRTEQKLTGGSTPQFPFSQRANNTENSRKRQPVREED